jgi:NADPH-dependent 2,4-dienoyl-CoA reductase/sulfur reductase-like enzyme/rhodanese-related sulfurtransferase
VKKVLIVGGVAGGASAAARLRRLDEEAKIIMFERGQYISFANCGLPYYISGSIKDREKLLVQTPQGMGARFNIDIRTNSEVSGIDRDKREVVVRHRLSGEVYRESYDYLLLSPGAKPVIPDIPGIDGPNVFTLRSLDDTDAVKHYLDEKQAGRAVVIGGGFIGLEMAESLRERGLEIALVEALDQVMTPLDVEMARIVEQHLESKGVQLFLADGVTAIEHNSVESKVVLRSGLSVAGDIIILSLGIRPESNLAADAGLELGERGTIRVNEYLQTSDPYIYAVGDVIETVDFVNGVKTYVPLAGPANRQGRIAADNIAGRKVRYKGTQGTSIAKIFELTVAATGNNEKTLRRLGVPYQKSYTTSASHAGYYPGAVSMNIKLLFGEDGRILGAQVVGRKGADKRIDVLATAIRAGMTVYDLEELELAYAPPYSSAKDPVNMAGFVAANILKGDVGVTHWHEIKGIDPDRVFLLDVRTPMEFRRGNIPGAVNIPLDELRDRLKKIPADKEVVVYCQIGLRAYVAARVLMHKEYRVKNLSGGYNVWSHTKPSDAGKFD